MEDRMLLAVVPEIRRLPQSERRQAIEQARYRTFRQRENNVRWAWSYAALALLAAAASSVTTLALGVLLGGVASFGIWIIGFALYQKHYWRLLRPELLRIVEDQTASPSARAARPRC